MLTRLQVTGFKNLVDVDVRFGPFTCVAGSNGVGKSNLFDAIEFLGALADLPLVKAAQSIRDGKTGDTANLFHRVGSGRDEVMTFVAEMIIPATGADDLGREVQASNTFLRYSLELEFQQPGTTALHGGLTLRRESLEPMSKSDIDKGLLFPHTKEWRRSVTKGSRSKALLLTMQEADQDGHQDYIIQQYRDDGESGGRPTKLKASKLFKTVLSTVNTADYRTALLARREMQSWRRLQLEPAALRDPDTFGQTARIGSNGSHLAVTLHRLAHGGMALPGGAILEEGGPDPATTYVRVANRLADLIDDVREVGVDEDRQRDLLTLFAVDKNRTKHPARALSDGTLRFLALAVIELDPTAQGTLCLEEPENGIHPARIPAMLRLLEDIAVDASLSVGDDNPLRQVIINTHSPAVVGEVESGSLVFAKLDQMIRAGQRSPIVHFLGLADTWRTRPGESPSEEVPRGDILRYLEGPRYMPESEPKHPKSQKDRAFRAEPSQDHRRVIDRPDIQQLLNFDESLR